MPEGKQTADDRVEQVKQSIDSELLTNADAEGVAVDTIIENQIAENSKYGVSTISRFAETAIRREYEAANAETIEGIVLGSRDRHGRNWPRRHSVVRSNGEHLEVSTWSGSLPAGDGTEMEIPSGHVVSMDVDYDEEYDSYEGARINEVRELSVLELADNLQKVAMSPDDITAGDEYETRVVRGEIQFVNPQTVFEDGEPAGDGEIMAEDDRGQLRPHFELVLSGEGETRFRAHVERQSHGKPYFAVPDLEALCVDAYQKYEEAERQAQFVSDGLRGVEVVLVGNVSGYNRDRDGDGNPVTYVDMGLTGMVGIERDEDQQGLEQFEDADEEIDGETDEETDDATDEAVEESVEDAEEDADDEPEDDDDPGSFEDHEVEDDSADEGSDDADAGDDDETFECDECGKSFDSQPALNGHKGSCTDDSDEESDEQSVESQQVKTVRGNIEDYCELTGESFDDLTVEDVNENLKGVEAPDVVIRAALNGSDGETTLRMEEKEPEDDDEESDGDIAERLLEDAGLVAGGTFGCPVDDCLASAGSASGVLGHAKSDHDTDGFESPLAWMKAELDA